MNWTECGCVRHSSKYSNVVYLEVWSFSSCLGPSQFAFLANNKRKTMGWWKTCRTTSSRSWSFSSNSSPLMSCCWLLLLGCWRCGVGGVGGRKKGVGKGEVLRLYAVYGHWGPIHSGQIGSRRMVRPSAATIVPTTGVCLSFLSLSLSLILLKVVKLGIFCRYTLVKM